TPRSQTQVGPDAAVDLVVGAEIVPVALVEIAIDLAGGGPEGVEGALVGEAGDVVHGGAEAFDGSAVVDGGEADGAVDDDGAEGGAQGGGDVDDVDVEQPVVEAVAADEVRHQGGVVAVG